MTGKLFSSDDHIDLRWLPRDLWTSRLPKALVENAPRVVERDGGNVWICEDKNWGAWGATLSASSGKKWAVESAIGYREGEFRPTIAALRMADMDQDGVETSVMYGPVTPLGVADPALRVACYRAYNDWLVEFCASNPRRMIGVGFLPVESADEAAAEVERLARMSMKQVNLLLSKMAVPAHDPSWSRFWDVMAASGMIVSCHFAASITQVGQKVTSEPKAADRLSLVKGWTQFVDPLVGLMAHGVLERHPTMKLVLAETGVGWLPFVIDRMDQRFDQVMDNKGFWDKRGGIPLKVPPSETFKRQVWLSFADDKTALALAAFFGEDHLMWASDYPHPDSTFPRSRQIIDAQMANMPAALREKLVYGNARKLYGAVN